MTDMPPDRLSTDPSSPYYDAALLERQPRRMGFAVGGFLLWAIGRIHRAVAGKLVRAAEKTVARSKIADLEVPVPETP